MSEAVETEEGLRRNSARVQRLTRSDEEEAEQDQDITDEEDEEKKRKQVFHVRYEFFKYKHSQINSIRRCQILLIAAFTDSLS